MNLNDVKKVTIVNTTATVDKDTGVVKSDGKNKWCIGVFFKNDAFDTLAHACEGMSADKNFGKYLKDGKRSNIQVLAHEFALEFGLKESSAVTENLAAAVEYVDGEKAERAKKEAEKKAFPELAAMRRIAKEAQRAAKIAEASGDDKFVEAVADIVGTCTSEESRLAKARAKLLKAQKAAEQMKAETEKQEKAEKAA